MTKGVIGVLGGPKNKAMRYKPRNSDLARDSKTAEFLNAHDFRTGGFFYKQKMLTCLLNCNYDMMH